MEIFLDHDPVFDGNPLARRQKDEGGKGHDAQPSKLEKEKNDRLSDWGKGSCGILNHQPSDTNCRGRGEEGIDKGEVP